ncbi:unnamed protein product [Rotaria sordida]|uniref:Uncharacterized protein n=1 Tax=Rotaria sordida TaxID=392033 RepID=A0A815KDB1_9BILA|nr:unnamed protein product [Rotaria sordida]CAF1391690.1 unnamed protein product [Rotaria sordida]CAF4020351.1 unnamed protein product [Rotaria sordida]CAF4070295.1 unnamed protein product [Rotaria sordida]CAF4268842.1 unnamed protein product [Rotaria sordida]
MDHTLILELPYALSECGDENEKVNVKSQLFEQLPGILIIRHGYDCYKMRSWLINNMTILEELKKWMMRVQVIELHGDDQQEKS